MPYDTLTAPRRLIEGLRGRHAWRPTSARRCWPVRQARRPPADPLALARQLTAKVSVPGKIKNRLTAAAQFIENFKHRKTLVKGMDEAFATGAAPSPLHHGWRGCGAADRRHLVRRHDAPRAWRPARRSTGPRCRACRRANTSAPGPAGTTPPGRRSPTRSPAPTLLYKPWGGACAGGQLPHLRQRLRRGADRDRHPDADPAPGCSSAARTLGFVFLGCRFNDQLPRAFARQIMKRSAGPHYAVLPTNRPRAWRAASWPNKASRASRCRWPRWRPPCANRSPTRPCRPEPCNKETR
jgi:hypothetical protein